MNLRPPPTQIRSFNEIQDNFSAVCKQIPKISIQNNAANEISVSKAQGEKYKSINMTIIKCLI